MPLQIKDDSPTSFPKPDILTLQNFKRGVITLINDSRLPKDALKEANNLFLAEDGQPTVRPGVNWFGTAPLTSTATVATAPTAAAGTNWTNPTNVYASDNSRGVYATTAQDNLKVTGFGFAIPTGATILGITATVEGNGTDATAANRSIELGLTKDGTTLAGTREASQNLNQTTDTTLTFGSGTNLWGTTLTVAEVNASTFGVLLRAANTNAGARNIDQVLVTVSYSYNFQIDGYDYFDYNGVIHLVAVSGGRVHRSTNDATTWTQCTGATLTVGTWTNMNQYNSLLELTNGVDNIVLYDGTTTLTQYTALATPTAPAAVATGLTGTANTYTYKVAAVNTIGFSIASPVSTGTIQSTLDRTAWVPGTNYASITTPTAVASQTRWDMYISEDGINYYYLTSATASSGNAAVIVDDGTAIPVPSTTAPTGTTAQGPLVEELVNVGSRMYGVRDTANKYRIWFSSGTPPFGAFSTAYDGGYLDWSPGGKFIPVKVVDYRDGKGTPLATIFCKSADGQGCVLQMSLDTLTIGDITITVPSAYRLPGSRGTPAPLSVVNVLNDYMFYNTQAFYNLGSRAQFLNLLSTDESSANIRPSVKQINTAAESKIAAIYFEANVYLSVPVGDTVNNQTMVYDTERKAWLPKAFTLGFSKFLRYTDQSQGQHLLCLKPGDTKLSEISTGFNGDYSEAFETSLVTGLYSTVNDRFELQFTEEGEFELANTGGDINIELLGIDRVLGYRSVKTVSLSNSTTVSDVGWGTFDWDTTSWDDTSDAPVIASEVSLKRYFPVQRELNAVQWHIFTNSIEARYILRTLQTWGTPTQGGHPSSWRLNPI